MSATYWPRFVAGSWNVSKPVSSSLTSTAAPVPAGCPAAGGGIGISSSGFGEMIFSVTGPVGPRPSG